MSDEQQHNDDFDIPDPFNSSNNDANGDANGDDFDAHFSDEELEAALAGFEKEFQEDSQHDSPSDNASLAETHDADTSVPEADAQAASDASSDAAASDAADPSTTFDDELQGLLGNKAKAAMLITRLTSPKLLAAFCQLSDISADCIGSKEGAVAILRNLDGDGPESAAHDLTIVVSGMAVVLTVNRADKLEATMYLQGKPDQTFVPPVLFSATAPFVEDLMLGISDEAALQAEGFDIIRSADLDHDQAMAIIAEFTRFGRGGASRIG